MFGLALVVSQKPTFATGNGCTIHWHGYTPHLHCPTPSPSPSPTPSPTPPVDQCPYEEGYQPTGPCEDECEYKECEEPSPTPEPPHENVVQQPAGQPQDCKNGSIGGIYVDGGVPNDNKVEVRWWPLKDFDKVHIRYSEVDGDWRYSLLDTENDGHEEIGNLVNGVHYWFQVGRGECWSQSFDPMP